MAERAKAFAFLLQLGLVLVRILVTIMKDKNVCTIGKPSCLIQCPMVPSTEMEDQGWKSGILAGKALNKKNKTEGAL